MRIYFKKMSNRLIFWFLIIGLLPLSIVTVLHFQYRIEAIREREFNKLTAIRELKIKNIENWLHEIFSDIKTLTHDPEILSLKGVFDKGRTTRDDDTAIESVRRTLNSFVRNHESYLEIFILNPVSGRIEISTNKAFEGKYRDDNPYYKETLRIRKIYIKDIFYSKNLNISSMTISSPLFDYTHPESIIGILVVRIDLDRSVFRILLDHSGLGKTGETLIVDKGGTVLNRLRLASEREPLTVKAAGLPALLASQGKNDITSGVDYRGEKVLATYGYVPTTQWGFMVKQDIKEINGPIKMMLLNSVLLILCCTVALLLAAVFLSKILTKPVLEMTEVSRKIREGKMTARNAYRTFDELGFLSQSFNEMADSLQFQMEVRSAVSGIIDILAAADNMNTLALELVKKLTEFTDSEMAGFYMLNEEKSHFEIIASIGLMPEAMEPFHIKSFEGGFGKTLANLKISHIHDIPEDTLFKFKTFTGDIIPKEIITIPVVVQEGVTAIISLASIKKYTKKSIEIIDNQWIPALNTSFSNLLANEETRRLAKELRVKNRELISQTKQLSSQAEELKQQSRELQRKNLELEIKSRQVEEANRLKSQFLSNMSHELRTPLNSVLALSRVLMMQINEKLSTDEINYLKIIERNGMNLLALIEDILDLSKIEAGRMDVIPRLFSPYLIVEAIVEGLDPIAQSKGVSIHSELTKDFPRIQNDEKRVQQILQNIIENGVKFTEKGYVTVSGKYDEERIYIKVKDTGIGISTKHLPHIFDEFRQVDESLARRFEGTGLGLAIADKTAKMLGGRISVESVPGKGSEFTLTLPILWQEVNFPAREPARNTPDTGMGPKGKTILVVDDDPDAVATISNSLIQEGYNTITATSGKEALDVAKRFTLFAITLDIFMPEMDGWEVLQGLKKCLKTRNIPVIIVSIADDKETGIALGAVGYLTKPVVKEELISEIKKVGRPEEFPVGEYTVMVVEDNDFQREEMARIIEAEGMNVILAENGARCVELLQDSVPNIVVLDLIMPEMDGFCALEKIRSNPATSSVPVIVVTAKDLTDEDIGRLCGNVSSVLTKGSNMTLESLIDLIIDILADIEGAKGPVESPHEIFDIKKEKEPSVIKQEPEQTSMAKGQKRKPSILVVEDNTDNMAAIKAVLHDRYDLVEARDGEQALKAAFGDLPDLVLLDISLPKIDGMTVVRKMRKNRKISSIPVIAMTARAMKGDMERILEGGCDDYISKPFDPEEVLSKVEKYLSYEKGNHDKNPGY
ncbi:MAG: response regulator [Thermodesulfobacteriota bacterium]|nr:response regulator [Thermodesulfobacteriota bacterium]